MSSPDFFENIVPCLKAGEPVDGIVSLKITSDSRVYRLPNSRILRISTPTSERDDGLTSAEGIASRIAALKKGQGLKGYEQLIAYSTEQEAVLTHEAPGKPLTELTTPEVNAIKLSHMEAAAHNIGNGVLRRIVLDSHPSNMIFEPHRGIAIIDYALTEERAKPSARQEYTELLADIGDIVEPLDTHDHHAAWSRVFEDGLTVLYQAFDIEPGKISPRLTFYQERLRS